MFLLNPVVTHPLVGPTKSRIPMFDRYLRQTIVASPKCEEPRPFAKCRFTECEAIGNDVDVIPDSNLDQCTTHIIFDQGPFHVVKNVLNEHCGRIIIKRKRVINSLLENTKKAEIKALEDISSVKWESDSVGSKISLFDSCM
jgi:hypothetical protein